MTEPIKICGCCARKFNSEKDFLENTSRWRICSRGNLWFNCSCNSTIMIVKGKYDWYNPSENISAENKSLFNDLANKRALPYIQTFVFELQKLLTNPEVDFNKITEILRREPIIASEIISDVAKIKQAKEDYSPINDIRHAAVFLGARRLSDILMLASVKSIKLETKIFSSEKFWETSYNAAVICEYLSKKFTPYHNSDEMYLAGFLMNIGKLMLAYFYPKETDDLVSTWLNPKNTYSWSKLEKINQLHSHVTLGEITANIWGLPDTVLQCIAGHHKPETVKHLKVSKSDMAVFANQMTHWAMYNLVDLDENVLKIITSKFGLTEKEVEELAKNMTQLIARIRR